ncbi:MAG: hypothetical protein HN368_13960, partial [Spirochaetales bacterium]|nr:hypothetical protein [Spirochaetales bacterium]
RGWVEDEEEATGNYRVHGTTRRRPIDMWTEERDLLIELPITDFLPTRIEERLVGKDCLISVLGNYYTVPPKYVRRRVTVIISPRGIKVYNRKREQIAAHIIPAGKGRMIIDERHYDELRRIKRYLPANQSENRFDMLYGESEGFTGVMQFCEEESLSFIPWGPLRQGLLTERYLDKAKVRPGDRLLDENMLDSELTAPVLGKLNKLAVKAEKYHISLAQLSIAYLLQLPAMGPVIVSSSTVEQLEENAGAGTILLDPDTIGEIEAVIGTETK